MDKLYEPMLQEVDFEHIFDISPDLLCILDLEHNIIRANQAFLRRVDISSKKIFGSKCFWCMHQKDKPHTLCVHLQMLKDGQVHTVEMFLEPLDGWFSITVTPLRDKEGKITGSIHIARDITERKKTEEKLLFLSKAIESASDAIGISNAEGHHIFQNKALTYLFEYETAEEIEAAGGGAVVVKEPEVAKEMFDNIMTGGSWSGELEMVTKSGRVFPAFERADAIKDSEGKILGLIGIITDITDRKKSEAALRESEEKYRTIIENMGEGYGFVNNQEIFVFANPSAEKIFGVGKGELAGMNLNSFLPAESIEIIKNETQKRRKGESSTYEQEIFQKDGSERVILLTATPSFEDEKFNGTFGIFRDITDRKKTEEALRESEAVHRNLVGRMPDGVYKSTHDGKFVDVNPAMIKMLGYDSKEELLAIDIKKQLYFEPTDRESLTLQEKLEELGVFCLKKKDGSAIWVEDHGWYVMGENEEIQFHEGILRDVTDRKLAEESLKEGEEHFRSIFENNSAAMALIELDTTISMVNEEYCKISGYAKQEVVGMSWTQQISPKELDGLKEYNRRRMINPKDSLDKYEFAFYRKSGELRHLMMSITMLSNRKIIASFVDITDRKQAEEEIKLKNEQLKQANAEKDKFFSIIAHDLRSPFQPLLGFTRMLVEEFSTFRLDEIQKMAISMRGAADKLFNLLENLLEWSRMQRGLTIFEPELFFILPKLSEGLVLTLDANTLKEIDLTYEVPDDLTVFADSNMFESIIRNLVTNAIKFTAPKGKITMTAKSIDDSWVEISIKDTGIGMNKEMLENLFRLDMNTNRKGTEGEPSSGLGLIICKDFIEKHDGKLWVESEEGKGSTFYFTLPTKSPN